MGARESGRKWDIPQAIALRFVLRCISCCMYIAPGFSTTRTRTFRGGLPDIRAVITVLTYICMQIRLTRYPNLD